MHLDMDTGWYMRYRRLENPECADAFAQVRRIVNRPSIPRTDADFEGPSHVQEIANTAAFHFGYIEHAGSSLYARLSQKVRRAAVLKIILGIGGDEIAHFLAWVDFAGSAVLGPPFSLPKAQSPVADHDRTFRDFCGKPGVSSYQTNPSFPVRGDSKIKNVTGLPVILPLDDQFGGAVATINSFTRNGLFVGQSPDFMSALVQMAEDADSAIRN